MKVSPKRFHLIGPGFRAQISDSFIHSFIRSFVRSFILSQKLIQFLWPTNVFDLHIVI